MAILKGANLALAFLLELCALAALGYWGFKVGRGTLAKLGLGLGAPLLAAVVWGLFVAPRATVAVPRAVHLALEVAVFGLAAVALYAAGQPRLALAFALVVVLNRVLIAFWGQ
jgi:quinol-cytochrome oxidoreductase complex cytochrome b subunit